MLLSYGQFIKLDRLSFKLNYSFLPEFFNDLDKFTKLKT